jgi:hypothetical protein
MYFFDFDLFTVLLAFIHWLLILKDLSVLIHQRIWLLKSVINIFNTNISNDFLFLWTLLLWCLMNNTHISISMWTLSKHTIVIKRTVISWSHCIKNDCWFIFLLSTSLRSLVRPCSLNIVRSKVNYLGPFFRFCLLLSRILLYLGLERLIQRHEALTAHILVLAALWLWSLYIDTLCMRSNVISTQVII